MFGRVYPLKVPSATIDAVLYTIDLLSLNYISKGKIASVEYNAVFKCTNGVFSALIYSFDLFRHVSQIKCVTRSATLY